MEDHSNFEQFKDDFINHVTDSEIIVDKIFIHEISGIEYFSRINTYQGYFQTSMDVIQRKCFPTSPGANIDSDSLIEYQNFIVNQQENCHFKGNNEKIGSFCVGNKTIVNSFSQIQDSCIGGRVKIEENSKIFESILFNKVKIGNNCTIKNCILTEGVNIKDNIHLENQVIIENNGEQKTQEIKFCYKNNKEKTGDETDESDLIEDESDEEDITPLTFEEEVEAIISRQIEEDHPIDSIRVEVNSIKFSKNKSNSECVNAIFTGLFNFVLAQEEESIPKEVILKFSDILRDYSELLKVYLISENEHATLIESIEKCLIENIKLSSGFHIFLQMAKGNKLIPTEAVLKWAETEVVDSHELRSKFLKLSEKWVDSLKNIDEEESDEEEEEESEESD